MINVFIDTQVFVQKNFDFKNKLFEWLIDAVEVNLINVCLTENVINEVKSKISDNVSVTVDKSQKKFIKDAKIVRNIGEYNNLLCKKQKSIWKFIFFLVAKWRL